MLLADINPFLRFAQLQPSIVLGEITRAAYDYRLFYIVEGASVFVTDHHRIPVSRGDVLFFRPGTFYEFVGDVKVMVLNFDLTRANAHRKPPAPPDEKSCFDPARIFENDPPTELSTVLVGRNCPEAEPLFQRCVLAYDFPTPYTEASASAAVKQLLCILLAEANRAATPSPEIIAQITLYLQTNFDRELLNTELSAVFGYHPIYLNRLFKRHTGMTLHRALVGIRLRNAAELLKQTSLPIELVQQKSGFGSRTQFSTAFSREMGMSPTEYRAKYQIK
ncbi:MAG: helix-turn-helix domain-containing protein [Clostridia bacterium]|nr:helix-turn-helix domain-containing protein [Clostridia bacterium]